MSQICSIQCLLIFTLNPFIFIEAQAPEELFFMLSIKHQFPNHAAVKWPDLWADHRHTFKNLFQDKFLVSGSYCIYKGDIIIVYCSKDKI